MAVCRRTVVRSLGGTGLALIGAGGVFAATRTPDKALKPWSDIDAPAPRDVRLDAFRHAILAPNPHNRQPWIIRLAGADRAEIACDLERRLPQTDPFDRQILIGFGCFLEVAAIAAAERGVRMEVTPFPDGMPGERLDKRPVAAVRFVPDSRTAKDPLFRFIPVRRSSKQVFDLARPVDPIALDALKGQRAPGVLVAATAEDRLVRRLRAQTWEAWNIEFQTKRTWGETVDLMRIGKSEIEANPDGVSVGGAFLEGLALAGQISRTRFATPGSTAHTSSFERYRPIIDTGMAYAWIATDGNTRLDQLAAGRVYVRMNLEAARQGLGFHPVSQALQEFHEMAATLAAVQGTLGISAGRRAQMLIRLGYGKDAPKTPRWPLESKLAGA
jgi:hypothetical protein